MAEKSGTKANIERVYSIPLGRVYDYPRTKRAVKAEKFLRSYVARHYRTEEDNVKLSNLVHAYIWRHGMKKPPRKIKIKTKKVDARVYVFTLDESDDITKFKVEKQVSEGKEKEKVVEAGEAKKPEKAKKEEKEETKHKKTKGEKLLETHRQD